MQRGVEAEWGGRLRTRRHGTATCHARVRLVPLAAACAASALIIMLDGGGEGEDRRAVVLPVVCS
jgi:hypothetical protein